MRKKLAMAILAAVLVVSVGMTALASSGGATPSSNGTEVWAGIILEDPDARIKVEVPTLFAFVVNGTTVNTTSGGVSSTDGTILLPNVKVRVTTPSSTWSGTQGPPTTGSTYTLDVIGNATDGTLPFINYSTYRDEASPGTYTREGLGVKINGNVKNEGTLLSRNNWTHTGPSSARPVAADFKNYSLKIDGYPFDTPAAGGLQMASGIALSAPNTDPTGNGDYTNVDSTTELAIVGETHDALFDVMVGGLRNQYKQVEQSAKVGTIVWTISAEITADVYSAPDNDYLDGTDNTDATAPYYDPDAIEY